MGRGGCGRESDAPLTESYVGASWLTNPHKPLRPNMVRRETWVSLEGIPLAPQFATTLSLERAALPRTRTGRHGHDDGVVLGGRADHGPDPPRRNRRRRRSL